MLPGRSGLEVLAALRDAKPGLPVIVLTALGRGRASRRRARRRRRRLPVKPFSLDRARGPDPRPAARRRADAPDDAERRRHRGRPAHPRGPPRRRARAPVDDRVRAARVPDAQPRPRALARADPARRVGLRVRPGHERGRRLRRLPAAQAPRRGPPRADRHGPLGRLPLRCAAIRRARSGRRAAVAADGMGRGRDGRLGGGRVPRRLPGHGHAAARARSTATSAATPASCSQALRPFADASPRGRITSRGRPLRPRAAVHARPRRCCSC